MKKRILSLLLLVAMIVALVPAVSLPTSAEGASPVNYTVKHVLHKQDGSTEEVVADEQHLSGAVGEQSAASALTSETYADYTAAPVSQIALGASADANVVTVDYYECDYVLGNIGGSLPLAKGELSNWTYYSSVEHLGAWASGGYEEWIVYAEEEGVYAFEFLGAAIGESPIKITGENIASGAVFSDNESVKSVSSNWKKVSLGTVCVAFEKGFNTLRVSPTRAFDLYAVTEISTPDNVRMAEYDCVFHVKGEEESRMHRLTCGSVGETVLVVPPEFDSFMTSSQATSYLVADASLQSFPDIHYYSENDASVVVGLFEKVLPTEAAELTKLTEYSGAFVSSTTGSKATYKMYIENAGGVRISFAAAHTSAAGTSLLVTLTNLDDPAVTASTVVDVPSTGGWSSYVSFEGTVTVPSAGYYSVEFQWQYGSVNVKNIAMRGLGAQEYHVNHYVDGVLYFTESFVTIAGTLTKAAPLDDLLIHHQVVGAIRNYVLTGEEDPDIDIYYYSDYSYGFLTFEKNGVAFGVNYKGAGLYLMLPNGAGLDDLTVTSAEDGVLTVDGKTYSLTAGVSVSGIDLSAAENVAFTSEALGFDAEAIAVMKSENLEALYITVDKDLDTVTKEDETAAVGQITRIAADGTVTVLDSDGNPETPEITEFLKRGSSSYSRPYGKYSYKFKLAKKAALVTDGEGNDVQGKSWCLIANNTQEFSGLGNAVAQDLYQAIGGQDALGYKFVNLYIGGVYQGVYQLIEKSTAETKDRIDFDEEEVETPAWANATTENGATYYYCANASSADATGFIFEKAADGAEKPYVETSRGVVFNVKEPATPSAAQMEKLAAYLQDFEDALYSENGFNTKGKHYAEYVDLDSMSTIFLVELFFYNVDWMANSTFLALNIGADGEFAKITSGSLWDMSCTPSGVELFRTGRWTDAQKYVDHFFDKGDFMAAMIAKNGSFKTALESEKALLAEEIAAMTPAMEMNEVLYARNFASLRASFVTAYNNRVVAWDNVLSDETDALRGVTVKIVDGTLTASAIGTCTYQWYKLAEDGYTGVKIEGATGATYRPEEDGTYYVVATGTALAGTTASSMVSNPVRSSAAPIVDKALSGKNVKRSISLLEVYTINFKVVQSAENDIRAYTDWVLVVEDAEGYEIARVTDWNWNVAHDRYWCAFAVLPENYNTVYNVRYEAKNESGETVCGETFEYGIGIYCQNQIEKEGNPQELKDLCQSIINTGDAAAAYAEYLRSLS